MRPANLYHYTHKLVSRNKLGELVIFGKLGELGELEDFAELEDFYQAGNFYQYPSKLEQQKDPAL